MFIMMKRKITLIRGSIAGLTAVLLLAAILSGCAANGNTIEEPDISGRIKEETGSVNDYAGWWQLADHSGAAPFACIEIPADDPAVVNCYDENGKLIDTGLTDYSEQRALNGNALMVFVFQNIGEYSVSPYNSGDSKHLEIRGSGDFSGTFDLSEPIVPAAKPGESEADSTIQEKGESMATLLYQGHGSLRITTPEGKVIYIDPYAGEGYDIPADLILITHSHPDHIAVDLIKTQNPDCRTITYKEALTDGKHQTFDLSYITIETVEAGNNRNHDITQCVGYIVALSDGKTIYISGDTSTTEQMKTLAARHLDYAFFCCDGRYNMDLEEASACAKLVGAKRSIPYHMIPGGLFSRERAEKFEVENRLILESGEEIEIE